MRLVSDLYVFFFLFYFYFPAHPIVGVVKGMATRIKKKKTSFFFLKFICRCSCPAVFSIGFSPFPSSLLPSFARLMLFTMVLKEERVKAAQGDLMERRIQDARKR